MHFDKKEVSGKGIKFSLYDDKEIGRAYLYILHNDLHKRPFGLLEDVFVDEKYRGYSYGADLVKLVVEEAKAQDCYKLICTSRHSKPKVHSFYKRLGFKDHGLEFRIDF